jgi:putative ABC transport system ATP-binding protein
MTIARERSAAEIDGITDGEAVARAEDLCKVYGTGDAQVVALDDVIGEFGRGRLTAIMGPSGSGKSTLMHCMAGPARSAGSGRSGSDAVNSVP